MDLLRLLIFILPSYIANSSPVVFGGGPPIDGGRVLWDGKRVFGNGKTVRGMVSGIAFGTLAAILLALAEDLFLPQLGFKQKVIVGVLLSAGTMAGDLLGSFIKRRLGIPQGERHEFFDQLLFLGAALLFVSPYYLPAPLEIMLLVVVTYVLHRAANYLAFALRLKKVPW